MTEQPIRRLDIFKDGRIVQYDRDEPGRGHAWMRMECLTLEEGVRRMGYVAPPPKVQPESASGVKRWFDGLFFRAAKERIAKL